MKTNRFFSTITILALCITTTGYQAQAQQPVSRSTVGTRSAGTVQTIDASTLLAQVWRSKQRGFSLMTESSVASVNRSEFGINSVAAGLNLTVIGSGTIGRLTKWTGLNSTNSFIGDSNMFEDKFGKVGIGTSAPTSLLTVAGVIQSTSGGFQFPDGTVQTSSAAGALFSVTHDSTLAGNGTVTLPLGVAAPLSLSGAVGLGDAVIKTSNTGTGAGVAGASTNGFGVSGDSSNGQGVAGFSSNSIGVVGTSTNSFGVRALSFGSGADLAGVKGSCDDCAGVIGSSISEVGVRGEGFPGMRAIGTSITGFPSDGLVAVGGNGGVTTMPITISGGSGVTGLGGGASKGDGGDGLSGNGGIGRGAGRVGGSGIVGRGGGNENGALPGLAGFFSGDVRVTGKLTVTSGMKMFHIDHPLDPENKYLNHAAIESSEVLNIYSGNITTDEDGNAVVSLPQWFEALNKDFRYQLTVVGTFSQAIIAEKIRGNRFVIRTNNPAVEVSWQVTGVRSDATARKYRFEVEEEKAERERGYYANPDAYGQPEERSIEWARNPQMMQQLRQRRIEAEQMYKQQPK